MSTCLSNPEGGDDNNINGLEMYLPPDSVCFSEGLDLKTGYHSSPFWHSVPDVFLR